MALFGDKDEAKGGNFKVKNTRVFCLDDSLLDNERRYRKVYDAAEVNFIFCEFNFYNKLFDELDWETEIQFVCINKITGEQLCKVGKKLKVPLSRNEIKVRDGWGVKKGNWWKPGVYSWVVSVDEKPVGETTFYITNKGKPTIDHNPIFSINQIKLFESDKIPEPLGSRTYLKQFAKDSRFVNVELKLDFEFELTDYPLELLINIEHVAGHQKGRINYFKYLNSGKKTLTLDGGYGSSKGEFWKPDKYVLDVIFMDNLVARVPFEIGETAIAQDGPIGFFSGIDEAGAIKQGNEKSLTFDEAKEDLEQLIGLNSVKKDINDLASYLQFIQVRKDKGLELEKELNLHSVFVGNPGTGKTTVAKMLGQIYYSLGLLKKPNVYEYGRADLVGEYIGQTAPKVKKALEKAKGAVLFIDEAYSLTDRGDKKDFGHEVIEVLLKELSEGTHGCAIIFAGYPKEMTTFLDSNTGLSSRLRNIIQFPDYSPEELLDIGKFAAEKKGIKLTEEVEKQIYKKLVEVYRNRDSKFGNARFINGIIDEAKENLALRLMQGNESLEKLSEDKLSEIQLEDIKTIFQSAAEGQFSLPLDIALLEDAFNQLNELIGLDHVKAQVQELVKLVKYYREIGKDISKSFSLHTVFVGNPGTGKTTVARLMVQFFKALGILERGQLIEVDRKDLVAGFVGQTAIKTSEILDKSIGGGLFIDEAYSLTESTGSDFGREAIETILKRMEDDRGKFMLIAAGYPEEMKRFLEANPGLMSRFDRQITFEDYEAEELLAIAKMMFAKEEMFLDSEAEHFLIAYLERILANKHKYFGNARTVRKITEQTIRKQHLRMADLDPKKRTEDTIKTILLSDIQSIDISENDQKPRGIGFNR